MTDPIKRPNQDAKGHFTKGNMATGGAGLRRYKMIGKLPTVTGRRALNRYLNGVERDLMAATPRMNVKKELLIKQVVRTEGLMRLTELYLQSRGPVNPGPLARGEIELQPVITKNYISFMNAQRQAILALGLDPQKVDEVLDLDSYIAEKDGEGDRGRTDSAAPGNGPGPACEPPEPGSGPVDEAAEPGEDEEGGAGAEIVDPGASSHEIPSKDDTRDESRGNS